jgi:hypothetical protein
VDVCEIVDRFGPATADAGAAQAQAIFTHVQKYPPGKLRFGDCTVDYGFNSRPVEVYPFGLTVLDGGESLQLSAFVSGERGDGRWLAARLQELEDLLRAGCRRPEDRISA